MENPKYRLGEIVLFPKEKGVLKTRVINMQGRITKAYYENEIWIYDISYSENYTEYDVKETSIIKSLGFPLYAESASIKYDSSATTIAAASVVIMAANSSN